MFALAAKLTLCYACCMMRNNGSQLPPFSLSDVTVRPVWGMTEQRLWDRLIATHHSLGFHGTFGRALRHVAMVNDCWVALWDGRRGRSRLGVRDRWLGWSAVQQQARLHLIANTTRFVVLDAGRVPNLASRVLGFSLRR